MKFNHGLKTLLNLPKNSTVLTVLGDTNLIAKTAITISRITALRIRSLQNNTKVKIGNNTNTTGISILIIK
jgi:hypothetical protein